MLFVKVLLLVVTSGTIAGVTYSQVQKDPTSKVVVVSNNHESKIRSNLEKQLDTNLLKHKQKLLNTSKDSHTVRVNNAKTALDEAEKSLQNVYAELNNQKNNLNTKAQEIMDKYSDLKTKDDEFKSALTIAMANDLDKNVKKENSKFYNTQQTTLNKEKDAIVTKINTIYSSPKTSFNSICSGASTNWTPTSRTTTTEEQTIQANITQELTAICGASHQVTTNISSNAATSTNPTTQELLKTAKDDRDAVIGNIRTKTQEYNSLIIEIRSKENESKMKLFHFKNTQDAYSAAQKRLKETENLLEELAEQIPSNQ